MCDASEKKRHRKDAYDLPLKRNGLNSLVRRSCSSRVWNLSRLHLLLGVLKAFGSCGGRRRNLHFLPVVSVCALLCEHLLESCKSKRYERVKRVHFSAFCEER